MLTAPKHLTLKSGKQLILQSPPPEHVSAVLEYLRTLFHESYRNMNWGPNHWDSFPAEEEAKILRDFADSPDKFMLSAYDGERIVGNLGLFSTPGDFTKHSARLGMGLIREFHNLGLGTALMNHALELARGMGLHRVELSVRTYNTAGIALYEKSGFQRVGLLKDAVKIDGEFKDEYLYQLILG